MNKTLMLIVGVFVVMAGVLLLGPKLSPTHAPETEGQTNTQGNGTMDQQGESMEKGQEMQIDVSKKYTAVLHTSEGDITIELNTKDTPITANNFIALAKKGFYDTTIFHRVIDGFMIQGGDPKGDGTGGPGYTIPDEIGAGNSNDVGTISMANAGPNTGGSQFFINLVNNNFLDDKHPVFGYVTGGMDVVESIGKAATDANDKPNETITITSIDITEE